MPTIKGQGFNPDCTPKKQLALDDALGHLMGSGTAIAAKAKKNIPYVVCDMTAGAGSDPTGDGSPIIIAEHVKYLRSLGRKIRFLCVDKQSDLLGQLQATMGARFPGLAIEYYADQATALATIPKYTVGLTYWDPTRYNDLDTNLLRRFGQSRFHPRMDILLTRECLAGYRMQHAAHCKDTLTLPDYLSLTGKRCNYIMQYAKHGWWSLGFADNWQERPTEKIPRFCDVNSAEGRAIISQLTVKEKAESPLRQGVLL